MPKGPTPNLLPVRFRGGQVFNIIRGLPVILSAAKDPVNSLEGEGSQSTGFPCFKSALLKDCLMRFFTSLRSVLNDKWFAACLSAPEPVSGEGICWANKQPTQPL